MSGLYQFGTEEQSEEYLKQVSVEYRFDCYHEKNPDACHRLADFLDNFQKDYSKAYTVYQYNCLENGFGHSCFKYGNACLLGRGCKKDMTEAYGAYQNGCDQRYGPSCHNAGLMHATGRLGEKEDFVVAADMFREGCDLDNIPSCQLLSTLYITGKNGLPKDFVKAHAYALKACDSGHKIACGNLSQMYRRGDGVDRSTELADKYKTMAIELHKKQTESKAELKFGQ